MHKENGLAERGWKTIVTMKDSMLVNSALPLEFWIEAMETANYLQLNVEIIPEETCTGEK